MYCDCLLFMYRTAVFECKRGAYASAMLIASGAVNITLLMIRESLRQNCKPYIVFNYLLSSPHKEQNKVSVSSVNREMANFRMYKHRHFVS